MTGIAEVGTKQEGEQQGGALQLQQARPSGLLRPAAKPAEVIAVQEETRALIEQALKPGRDYGLIPGTDKPSLFKPGAERVCLAFGTYPRFKILEQEVDHDRVVPWVKKKKIFEGRGESREFKGWQSEEGTSMGLYRYVFLCEIVHRESGAVVGECIASCSTLESKYIDRPRDSENTVIKMGEKRAHVGATLLTFGLSDQFTQDVEDMSRDQLGGEDATATVEDTGRTPAPPCPKCQGPMYDNRDKNLERKAAKQKPMPDFKCKQSKGACGEQKGDRFNETVIWHEKKEKPDEGKANGGAGQETATTTTGATSPSASSPPFGPDGTRSMTQEELSQFLLEADAGGLKGGVAVQDFIVKTLGRKIKNPGEIKYPDEVALLVGEFRKLSKTTGRETLTPLMKAEYPGDSPSPAAQPSGSSSGGAASIPGTTPPATTAESAKTEGRQREPGEEDEDPELALDKELDQKDRAPGKR